MRNVYSVSQINAYIRRMFTEDYLLHNLLVRGEVSNCKYHASGHIYFTLKDASGTLSCVMFAGRRRGLSFHMQNGDQVIVAGAVDVYAKTGSYQLYANQIIRDGIGALAERFEQLKKKLLEQGMFDASYKQPIPPFVRRLGVVTAATGAAVRDIIQIARRRNPYIEIILYPAIVQGEAAPDSIIRGIRALEAEEVDVIIIGRGGGSLEDLWAFNEERVAEAVFDCTIPIISAVGPNWQYLTFVAMTQTWNRQGEDSMKLFIKRSRHCEPTLCVSAERFSISPRMPGSVTRDRHWTAPGTGSTSL